LLLGSTLLIRFIHEEEVQKLHYAGDIAEHVEPSASSE